MKGNADSESTAAEVRIRARVTLPVNRGGAAHTSMIVSFTGIPDEGEHVALVFGEPQDGALVRLHSECLTGDVFGSGRCDCGSQLEESVAALGKEGGVLLYLRQEGRGIGLYNKLDAYLLQDEGLDTYDANRALDLPADGRDYSAAAAMLKALGLVAVRLLSNNPRKVEGLRRNGVEVLAQERTGVHLSRHNARYLATKRDREGHLLIVPN